MPMTKKPWNITLLGRLLLISVLVGFNDERLVKIGLYQGMEDVDSRDHN